MPQQRLFVSDSFAVLQEALVTGVQTLKAVDPLLPLTVLVPHEELVKHLQRAIALASGGYVGVSIYTMNDFAHTIMGVRFAEEGQQSLTMGVALLIVRRLLKVAGMANYFSPAAVHPGFFRNFLATIRDLKQAQITPSQFATFLGRAQLGATSRHKMASLAALYRDYIEFLEEHRLYDSEDLLAQAAVALSAHAETSPLLLYGYTALTPLQRRLVEVSSANRDTWVFLPWGEGPAYESVTPLIGWLTSMGFQRSTLRGEHRARTNLARIQMRLFESVSTWREEEPFLADSSVVLIAVPSANREAREIGRTILTLVREHHLRFADIAVLLPPAASGLLLGETLTQLGIPHSFTKGVPLQQTPAGQSLLLLCQLLTDGYPRACMFEFLHSAHPPFPELLGDGAKYAQLAHWEALARDAQITRGAEEWRSRLSHLQHRREQRLDDEEQDITSSTVDQCVVQAFALFVDQFLADTGMLPPYETWHGWAKHMLTLLAKYVSPSTYTDSVAAVLTRLAQMAVLEEKVSLREWSRVVADALANTFAPSIARDSINVVTISDIFAARGLQFRAVIIPDMVEGQFPQTIQQDPLLLDAERQYLSEILLCDLHQQHQIWAEERLALLLATQIATATLVLSYARHDDVRGRAHMPSSYLFRVVEAMSGRPVSLADLRDWCQQISFSPLAAGPPTRALDALEFHAASVEQAQVTGKLAVLGYLPTVTPFFSAALTVLHQRWDMLCLTPFDGICEQQLSQSGGRPVPLFSQSLVFSASALETYARCPFRYFLTTILQLSPEDDIEQRVTLHPRQRGTLVHEILHEFFLRLQREQRLPVQSQAPEALLQVLTEVANRQCALFARTHSTGPPVLWELEQERLHTQLSALSHWEYEQGDSFLPTVFEASFGQEESSSDVLFFPAAPVTFTTDETEDILLRGRIDRIDLSPDGQRARIVDYKSGKPLRGRFAGGTAIQLPLYLFAARLLRPDLRWESAEHMSITRPARKEQRSAFVAETWEEDLLSLRRIVGTLTRGIRAGYFPMTPDTCRPCPFSRICGAQAEILAARKCSDERVAFLAALRDIP